MNRNNPSISLTWVRVFVQLTLFLLTSAICYAQQVQQPITIRGNVVSEGDGNPLHGASVAIEGTGNEVKTDSLGYFTISTSQSQGTITISYIGYETAIITYSPTEPGPFHMALTSGEQTIEEVVINTGYQQIPRERATGSFDHIGNELINRSVSPDILTRLENLTPGILFNHGDAANTDPFLIRGRSTINAEAQPLIVLDDFPYDGDLSNINPNDIESISILKDAAAASIWGARAGNGVIVIVTKKGRTATPKVELVSNVTVNPRPDLYNINQMSPTDRIELERYLFENGRYAAAVNPTNLANRVTGIPEAVELMIENPADLDARLTALGNHNVLDDLSKYFYRISANQQYNLNVSGNQERLQYYMSGGFDRNLSNLVGESHSRVSIRSSNTYRVNDRLSFNAAVNFFNVEERNGNNDGINTTTMGTSFFSFSPYTRLADDKGNALPIYLMRQGYIDTAGNGRLLDWHYRPLDEIHNEEHTIKRKDYMVNVGSNYRILDGLEALVKYQFQSQVQRGVDLFGEQSYYARNNINNFTQINQSTGAITYPFPRGGILWRNDVGTTSHQGRAQLNFNRYFGDKHAVTGLAGFEVRRLITTTDYYQNLGYNEETGSIVNVIDTETYYPQYSNPNWLRVNMTDATNELRDNFLSYFGNAAYTYDRRYTFSGSFRKDEANLFGLNTNQKGTPLWSLGGAWELSNEAFYDARWLPYAKLRLAYGINGNISRRANAVTTITTSTSGFTHPLPTANLGSLPNSNLSWEKVKQLNVGVDFATAGNRISGTIEYYNKDATDLLAQTPIDPTYGVNAMYMNVADMAGKGVEVQLNTINLNGPLNWQTRWMYSHVSSKVTNYHMPVATTGRTYLPISLGNPLIGKPLFSVFALPWQGLDHETGNPIGLVNGEQSTDYNAIYNTTPLEDLVFFGTAQPTHFGAVMNTFNYRNFDLSFNISYKLGYYFRRTSINYADMYERNWRGHSDYALRWQQPGDELHTDVLSRIYPANVNRDIFYQFSETLVERGDHIRLEDINFGYNLVPKRVLKSVRLFAYISNLGILWKSNDSGIEPYYHDTPLQRPNFSFGTNFTF